MILRLLIFVEFKSDSCGISHKIGKNINESCTVIILIITQFILKFTIKLKTELEFTIVNNNSIKVRTISLLTNGLIFWEVLVPNVLLK